MNKITTLIIGGLFFCALSLNQLSAQTDTVFLSLTPDDVTLDQGEEQTYDIQVESFAGVVSFQYSFYWDTTILDFVSVGDFNPGIPGFGPGNVGVPGSGQAPNGVITVSYLNFNLMPLSLPDGAVLMSMTFEAIGQECDIDTFDIPMDEIEVSVFENGLFTQTPAVFSTAVTSLTCPNGVCGVTIDAAPSLVCLDTTDAKNTDTVLVEIPYIGIDSVAVIVNNGPGTIGGDNPAMTPDGTILIEGLIEGDTFNITLTGGACDLTVTGSIPDSYCSPPVCGISEIQTGAEASVTCLDLTAGPDEVLIEISYVGIDTFATIVNNGSGTIGGDNPAMVENGTITLSGLSEGDSWDIEITGGPCMLQSTGMVPSDFCMGICMISGLNDPVFLCQDATGDPDPVVIEISYTGMDPAVSVINNAGGTIGGDNPATTPDGTILITGLLEGDAFDISVTGGNCNLNSAGTVPGNLCVPDPCGILELASDSEAQFVCEDSTQNNDLVTIQLPYTGLDPNALVTNNGAGTIGGDDPSMVENGVILLTGLSEGDPWDISISGGSCQLNSTGTVPLDLCPAPDCGITAIQNGSEAELTCSDSTMGADMVSVQIEYTGVDPNAIVVNNGAGMVGGDDPALVANGVIILSGLTEGQSWDIRISGGNCDLQSTGSIPSDYCPGPVCGLTELATENEVLVFCQTATSGTDQVTLQIPYTGIDANAILTNNGSGMLGGDDPAMVEDGVITLTGLSEGDSWNISISGGGCSLSSTGTVAADECVAELTLDIGEVIGEPGDTVCVDIYAQNFINLLGLEYIVQFDTSLLNFVGIENIAVQGMSQANFNISGNSILLSWNLFSTTGVTLPDSAVIYQMCFEIEGDVDAISPVVFDTSNVILAAMAGVPPVSIPVTTMDGSVTIQSNMPPPLEVSLNCPNGEVGDTVCLDVIVNNFTEIAGLEYTIIWEETDLQFLEVANFGFPELTAANFNPLGNQLVLYWSSLSGQGQTLADGSTLYQMCMVIIGGAGTSTPLEFTGNAEATVAGTPPQLIEVNTTGCAIDIDDGASSGDLTVSIGNGSGECGTIVCAEVSVENFTDIIGLEYTVTWDPTVLDFQNVTDLNLSGLTTGNFNELGNNQLLLSWNPFSSTGNTLADGTAIYSMCFNLVGDAGDMSSISFTGNSEATQAGNPPIQISPIESNAGSITVSSCGGGGGGGELTVSVGSGSGECGTTVCVDVTVDNFDDIIGLEYTVTWDPTVLDFQNVTDLNLSGLTTGNFNELGNNSLLLSWNPFSSTGITLADGTAIYSMCFNLVGDAGDMSSISFTGNSEATQAGNPPIQISPIESNGGSITVSSCGGGGGGGDLTVSVGSGSGECGTTVCVDVTVDNFDDIIGLEYTVTWDPTVLDFQNVTDLNLSGLTTGNFNELGNNSLLLSWNPFSSTGITLADGTAIYSMCFNLVGDAGDMSSISFTGNSEATQAGNPPIQISPIESNAGSITVSSCGGGGGGGDLTVSVGSGSGECGTIVCVDVTVDNFDDIIGLEYTVTWDPTVLDFQNVTDLNLSGLTTGNFNELGNNQLLLSWNPFSSTGITLADGTSIYSMCFNLVGGAGDMSSISFTGNSEATQAGNPPIQISPIETNAGSITVSGCSGGGGSDLTISVGSGSGACGTIVCANVTVDNFDDIIGLEYTVTWDPTVLDFQNVTNLNLSGLSVGNFNELGNNQLLLSWNPFSPTGVTLADGTAIYSMCFELVGDAGDLSSISFTGNTEATMAGNPPTPVDPVLTNNGQVTVSSCSGGVPGDLTVNISEGMGANGDTVCLEVTVENFEEVLGLEYTIAWDPAVAQFLYTEGFGLPDLSNANFNLSGNNQLILSWNSNSPVTVADSTLIYRVCFRMVGGQDDMTDVSFNGNVEATAGTPPNVSLVPVVTNNGKLTVTEGVATNDLVIDIGTATGENGDVVCVDVMVTNFSDISGLEYTVEWDPAILSFENVQSFDLPDLNTANFNQLGTDRLIVSWNANAPVSRPDGTVIYEMCFEILGNTGDQSPIDFMGEAEATQGFPPAVVPVDEQGGAVSVTGNFPGLTLYAECPSGSPGDEICIPVRVDGFTNIFGGQFSIHWNPAVLQFTMGANFNPAVNGLVAGNLNVLNPGTAGFQWTDPFFNGVTLPDGSVLFEMCFEVVGNLCDTTTFSFDGNPVDLEFATIIGLVTQTVPVLPQGCLFEVNGCNAPDLNASIMNVRCHGGSDGSISLTAGGIAPFTYAWSGLPASNDPAGMNQTDLPAGTYCVTVSDANSLTATACYDITEPAALVVTGTVAGEVCLNDCAGTIDLSVSGGTGPYSFDWDDLPGAVNVQNRSELCAGEYCVTVTDANDCTETACFTIDPGQQIFANADVQDVSCAGFDDGRITMQVTGSINVGFAWNPPAGNTGTLTDLAPGTYCVTVTDNMTGCSTDSCFEIGEAPSFEVNVTSSDVSCHGGSDGSIILSVIGQSMDFSYDWAAPVQSSGPEASDLPAGDYSVTITDNQTGCTEAVLVTLGEPTPLSVSIDSTSNPLCNGNQNGALYASAMGGTPPYTAEWISVQTGGVVSTTLTATGLGAGCYNLVLTDDNDCTIAIENVCLSEPAPLMLDAVLDNPSAGVCDGSILLQVSGGSGPYTTSWSGGLQDNLEQNDLCPGVYCVTVTDVNGCESDACYSLFCPLAVSVTTVQNPSCSGQSNGSVDITPSCGVPPYTFLWSNSTIGEDLVNVSAGAYSVTVTDALGNSVIASQISIVDPAPLSISSVNIKAATCLPNGSINISVIGGQPTYTYIWSNGAVSEDLSMLSSDEYQVTITDADGCVLVSPNYFVPFDPNPPLIEEVNVIPVTCFGAADGQASVIVDGCAPPFEFFWVENASGDTVSFNMNPKNLAGGVYTLIVVDDFGQQTSQMVTIPQPNPIAVLLDSVVHETCPDGDNGQIFISVVGGNAGGYSYAWNSIASTNQDPGGLSAGLYQVTVTDTKGCTAQSSSFQINPLPPCICNAQVTNITCPGDINGAISLTLCDAGLSYQYNWSQGDTLGIPATGPQITGVPAGQYYVTITNPVNGASETAVYSILEPADWNVTAALQPADECFTGSIDQSVSGSNGNYTYLWNDGATTQDRTGLPSGNWAVTITDGLGCTFTTDYVVDGPPCYEVAVSDEICAGDANGAIDLTIFGFQPVQVVWEFPDGSTVNTVDLGNLAPGAYTVTITDGNGTIVTESFTIGTASFLEATVQINGLPSCFSNNNGSATALAQNGTGNLTYEWCNGVTVPTATNLAAGSCSVTVTDLAGCQVVVPFEISNAPLGFTTQEETCPGDCDGRIQVLPAGGVSPYQFAWNDPMSQSGPIAQELCAGQYTVTVSDALGRNCVVTAELLPADSIGVLFDVTPARLRDGAVLATGTNGTPPYTYLWSTGQNDPRINGLAAGIYSVTVIDADGCVAEASVEVPGNFDCGTARQVITPNFDGYNDFFVIQCAETLENELKIYNRFGTLVFEATNYSNDWDGRGLDGEPLQEDGYFFVFEYRDQGENFQVKGSVTILRE